LRVAVRSYDVAKRNARVDAILQGAAKLPETAGAPSPVASPHALVVDLALARAATGSIAA
jgi:hypothetical protein